MKTIRLLILCLSIGNLLNAQNVGISNDATFTTPQSPLHIYWTNDGNLLQLSRSSSANTGLTFSVSNNDYSILNRQNNALIFGTNSTERMRIRGSGDIVIGGTDPGITGDLFSVISTSSFPWAVNGYANNDGGAIYGEIRSGNATNFCVSEFEHYGSGAGFCIYASNNSTNTSATSGTGIYGESSMGHNGSNFYSKNFAGIYGVGAFGTDQYSFGVVGLMVGTGRRSGGVMGTYSTSYWGALGYMRSNGTPYGLCYIGGATTTAKTTNNVHYGIGMSGWGDLMGGHICGEIYGLHISGNRYGLYVNGLQFVNKTIVQLNEVKNSNERIPTFMLTSLSKDIIDKGVTDVQINQETRIYFNSNFSKIINKEKPIIITVTPLGSNVNVYVLSYDEKGFIIKCERINNQSQEIKNSVKINWIAIATIGNDITLPNEILPKTYDEKMSEFLVNEADTTKTAIPMWWDGQNLRFEPIPSFAYPKKHLSKQEYLNDLKIMRRSNNIK